MTDGKVTIRAGLAAMLMVVAAGAVGMAAPRDRQMGGIGLSVWVDSNFRGRNATFLDDQPNLARVGMEGRISSLRVGPGETWEVCANFDFQGPCQVFSGSESDLRRRDWNDRIMSVRRVGGGRGGPGGGRGGPGQGQQGLILFRDTNFRGDQRALQGATPALGSWNDRARSLRVFGGRWEVCEDIDFGQCRLVDRDIPDLAFIGLSRRVSSARPAFGFPGRGGTAVPRSELTIFDRTNFRGTTFLINSASGSIGSAGNRANSVRVTGAWELCEGRNFTGRCVTVTNDLADLARVGLRNRLGSARPASWR